MRHEGHPRGERVHQEQGPSRDHDGDARDRDEPLRPLGRGRPSPRERSAQPDRHDDRQRPEEEEVQVLQGRVRPVPEVAHPVRDLAVPGPQEALDRHEGHEEDGCHDARPRRGPPKAAFARLAPPFHSTRVFAVHGRETGGKGVMPSRPRA